MALSLVKESYLRAQARYSLPLNMAIGGVVACAGDACMQHLEGSAYSARRTLDMGIVRSIFMTPFLHVYFPFLARVIPGTTWSRVVPRVLLDQVVGAPITTCIAFSAASLLKGCPEKTLSRIEENLVPTMLTGASYWPFVHLLNFRFVHPSNQSLVAHFASVYWMMVLSNRSQKKLAGDRDGGETAAA